MRKGDEFQKLRLQKWLLAELKKLSDFDDDGVFIVEIKKPFVIKAKVKAPSRPVLESAILRLSFGKITEDEIEIKQISSN